MTYLIQFTRQFTGVKEGPSEFSTGPLVVEDANEYMVNKIIAHSFDESPEIKGAMVYSLERTNEEQGLSQFKLLFYAKNFGYNGYKRNLKMHQAKIIDPNAS